MQLFFFDTETTWFQNAWWRIIQMWAIYWRYDKETDEFYPERIINQYINTDAPISDWAFKVHWITKDKISKFKKMDAYIKEFLSYINKSDLIVCHNVMFDILFLKNECKLCWIDFDRDKKRTFCTMNNHGVMEFMWSSKFPRLQELHEKIFWKKFEDAHDAMADIEATKNCFLELYKQNKITLI